MENRVTTFRLQWINCGLVCGDDVVKEEITIRRQNHLMNICSYNGRNELVASERIKTGKEQTDEFFGFLSRIRNDFEADYRVDVCDGSAWTMQIWDSTRRLQKVSGTVKYPPHGKEMEQYLTDFIENAKGLSVPTMFGCSG